MIPTDTIYGIVGSALLSKTVEEIYILRKRALDKPMVVLIAGIPDLEKFDIKLTSAQIDLLNRIWPNPVSVILSCPGEKFSYLHRGKKSLAFRMPKNELLSSLLKESGPLAAPSANFEREKSSETVEEAKRYFGDKVSFYVDGGRLKSKPSTVIQLYKDGTKIVLREGRFPMQGF